MTILKNLSIFISHSSKDKNVFEQFVNKILVLGCGIKDSDIFCSSIAGLGINSGENFRRLIKDKLLGCQYSFIMISNNYKQSEVCLNEMGASWALEHINVKQFLFPDLGFDYLRLLMNVNQASRINHPGALDQLFEEFTRHNQPEKRS